MLTSLAFPLAADASVSNNQVQSQHIAEADGTSGQNTNSGAGVKTGHIQDGAVTGTKIADGAVTDAKIAGPISGSKISSTGLDADSVDGKHAADLAPVIHGHGQADVTGLEAALSGKAEATHGHSQADVVGLESALAGKAELAHEHDTIYQKKYSHVITVSPVAGEAAYTDPAAAVASIIDSSPTNRYLVRLLPGVFYPSYGRIVMKSYVDVEGSGRHATRIVGGNPGYAVIDAGAGVTEAELRSLTVEAVQGYAIESLYGVRNVSVLSTSHGIGLSGPVPYMYLKDVEITAAWHGIVCSENHTPTVLMENVVVNAAADGVDNFGDGWGAATMILKNVTLNVEGRGIATNGAFNMQIENSTINSIGKGIDAWNSNFVLRNVVVNPTGDGTVPAIVANGEVRILQGSYVGTVTATTLKAAGAQFSTGVPAGKLVNCFNAAFDRIPDQ